MNVRRIAWGLAAGIAAIGSGLGAGPAAKVKQAGPFCTTDQPFVVRSGEEQTGDRYVMGASGVDVDGTHHGDLFAWSPKIAVDGILDGDFFAAANSIDVTGTVRDSMRAFGQNVDIDGTIEGDLIVFAAMLNLKEGARITGDVFGSAAHFNHHGRVDGDVRLTTGETTVNGSIGGNLRIKADVITLGDQASIEGDLTYTSRKELPADAAEHVGGEIVHKEVVKDDGDRKPFTAGTVVRWLYWPVASFIVGAILLGLSGRHRMLPVQRMNQEGWIGLAIGLFALPVLAVASVVAVILVLTIPLGVIGLLLLVLLTFIGKIPAAVWVGSKVLGLRGAGEPSPYLSLALGLLVVYLLFSIPFFIGMALWYVTTSAGIGALILAIVALRQADRQTAVET